MSPFSPTAAFADNVLPLLSLFSPTSAFADNVLPLLSPFSPTAAFVDYEIPVMLSVTRQKAYNLNIISTLQLNHFKKSALPFYGRPLSFPPTIAIFRYKDKQKILTLLSAGA
jgi:hypothetical protein